MTARRRIALVACLLVLTAAALAAASWMAARTWGPALARERLSAGLAEVLGRPVRVERVSVEPWLGRVVIAGVETADGPTTGGVESLSVARLEARLGLSSLWRGRVVVRRVIIEDAAVSLVPAGGPPMAALPVIPARLRLGPVEVEVGAILLRGATLAYRDPGSGLAAQVHGLDATLRPGDSAVGVELEARALEIEVAGHRERLAGIRASAEVHPRSVDLVRVSLTWEGHELRLEGRVISPLDSPGLAVRVDGQVDLAAIAARVEAPWPLAGVATISAALSGSAQAPTLEGRITADRVAVGTLAAEELALDLRLDRGVLSVSQAAARTLGGALEALLSIDLARPESARIGVRGRGLSVAELEPLLGTSIGVSARLDFAAEAEGDPARPERLRGRAQIEARAVRVEALAGAGPGTVHARGTFAGGVLDLEAAEARWPGLRLAGQGRAATEGPRGLRITGSADLARLGALLGVEPLAGKADLDAEIRGSWTAPAATGRLELRSPGAGAIAVDRAEIAFELTPPAFRVERGIVAAGRSRIAVTARGDWPAALPLRSLRPEHVRGRLEVRTDGARIEDLAPLLPAPLRGSGDLAAAGEAEGTLAAWRASGQLDSARIELPGAPPIRDLAVSVRAAPGRVEVSALSARVLGGPVAARGEWRGGSTADLTIEAGPVDLAQLAAVPAWIAPTGRVRLVASVAARGGDLAATARATAEQVSLAGIHLGAGSADASVQQSSLRASLDFPAARLSARAAGPVDGSAPLALQLAMTDFSIEPALRRAWPDLAAHARGTVSAAADLAVPLTDIAATRGTLRVEPVRLDVGGQALEARGPIVVSRDPGRVRLDRLVLSGAAGELSARGSLADTGAVDGSVQARLELGLLAALAPALQEASGTGEVDIRIGGTLAAPTLAGTGTLHDAAVIAREAPVAIRVQQGRLSLDAPGGDPRAARATFRLDRVEVEVAGEQLRSDGPVLLRREPGQLVLETARLSGRAGELRLAGRMDDDGRLQATLTGHMPLALLPLLRPEIREAGGSLRLDVRVGGRAMAPTVLGTATIADGLLALRDYPAALRAIQGRVTFAPDRVRIDDVRAALGSGSLRARGDVALDGGAIGPYQVTVEARGVAGPAQPGLETLWDADLELVGRGQRGQLRGEARLERGLYTRDLALLSMLLERQAGEQAVDVGREIFLRVAVQLQDNMVVRTRQASLRAGGTLTLQGTLAAPVLFGIVEAREGSVIFRRNRFTLESAVVRFDDPRRIDPILDVRATTRLRAYDIAMELTGRVEELQVRLSSVPPLPQEDLLALVTLGATREQLARSPGMIFAGEAGRLLIEGLLGLDDGPPLVDVFEVETSGPGGPQVTVGRRMTEQATVVYTGSFAEGGQQKLRVEYQLLGPLLLAGEQNFRGGVGGDIVLRLRFR